MWRKAKPILAAVSCGWLSFVALAAFYARVDESLSDAQVAEPNKGLPFLQDIYYQGTLWGTAERVESPSWDHWFGTDVLGRDMFARVIAGGYQTVWLVVGVTLVGAVFGGLIGATASWFAGRFDWTFHWFIDALDAFPPLILLMLIISTRAGPLNVVALSIIVGLLFMPSYIRAARSASSDWVGERSSTIPIGDILANVLPALVVVACANAATVVALEATLSFLGLGPQLPSPTWGSTMNEGRSELGRTILPIAFPAFFVVATMLSFNQLASYVQQRIAVAPHVQAAWSDQSNSADTVVF